jgi:hypothetical protein
VIRYKFTAVMMKFTMNIQPSGLKYEDNFISLLFIYGQQSLYLLEFVAVMNFTTNILQFKLTAVMTLSINLMQS